MRVLFLTLYPEAGASSRYRVHQFLPYLRAHGLECHVAAPLTAEEYRRLTGAGRSARPFLYHLHETRRRVAQILGARRYDVVFLQKSVMTAYVPWLPSLLRRRSRRLVYDIDDAVFLAPPHPLPPWLRWLEDRGQIGEIMSTSDVVLAGNTWLADRAKQSGAKRVETFPTVVDTDRFVPPTAPPHEFRIGWIGSPSTAANLRIVTEAANTLSGTIPCVALGAGKVDAPWEAREWRIESEVSELQRFSVGLMPLDKTEWNLGKCALKVLQYMACGVPCIATPWGAVRDVIQHDVNGLFADNAREWIDAIECLRDPDTRARIAAAGRETVCERYSLASATPRLLELLRSVV